MKIIPKSSKAKVKQMRERILEQMEGEQAFQENLRKAMITSDDKEEISKVKLLFDESVKHWEVLKHSLEEYDKLAEKKWKISPDTLLVVGANLLGIVLILKQEKIDIVSSKALSFVLKGRV